jgi:hypothetical protein
MMYTLRKVSEQINRDVSEKINDRESVRAHKAIGHHWSREVRVVLQRAQVRQPNARLQSLGLKRGPQANMFAG